MALPTYPTVDVFIQPRQLADYLVNKPYLSDVLALLLNPYRKFVMVVGVAHDATDKNQAVHITTDTRVNAVAAIAASSDYILTEYAIADADDNTITDALVVTINVQALVALWRYGLMRSPEGRAASRYLAALEDLETIFSVVEDADKLLSFGCSTIIKYDQELQFTTKLMNHLDINAALTSAIESLIPVVE